MKKEPRLLGMFEIIQAKDETLIKGKWKRVPEEDVGEPITRDDIGQYRRFEVVDWEED